jgi:hypothetical protein
MHCVQVTWCASFGQLPLWQGGWCDIHPRRLPAQAPGVVFAIVIGLVVNITRYHWSRVPWHRVNLLTTLSKAVFIVALALVPLAFHIATGEAVIGLGKPLRDNVLVAMDTKLMGVQLHRGMGTARRINSMAIGTAQPVPLFRVPTVQAGRGPRDSWPCSPNRTRPFRPTSQWGGCSPRYSRYCLPQ